MAQLIVTKNGPIGNILISNIEKMNAMTMDMWSGIPKALNDFDADPEVRVIVIRGDGEKAFISGADISQFEKLRSTADAQELYNNAVSLAYAAPGKCTKPVIASIRGYCFGGGLGFAAACDIRICSEDAQFRMPAARLGLGYAPDGINRFINLIGAANTADIFYSARRFDATDALHMGYVSQVHPADQLAEATDAYLKILSENAPMTMAATKFAIKQCLAAPHERDFVQAMQMVKDCFASNDYIEGRKAFIEKRTPRFKGD